MPENTHAYRVLNTYHATQPLLHALLAISKEKTIARQWFLPVSASFSLKGN
jgi:hypothetical protein